MGWLLGWNIGWLSLPGLGVEMRCWVLRERATRFSCSRGDLVGRELGVGKPVRGFPPAGMTVPASKCLAVSWSRKGLAGGGVTGVSVGCVCSLLVNCIVDVSIFICAFFVRNLDGHLLGGRLVCVS